MKLCCVATVVLFVVVGTSAQAGSWSPNASEDQVRTISRQDVEYCIREAIISISSQHRRQNPHRMSRMFREDLDESSSPPSSSASASLSSEEEELTQHAVTCDGVNALLRIAYEHAWRALRSPQDIFRVLQVLRNFQQCLCPSPPSSGEVTPTAVPSLDATSAATSPSAAAASSSAADSFSAADSSLATASSSAASIADPEVATAAVTNVGSSDGTQELSMPTDQLSASAQGSVSAGGIPFPMAA